MKKRRLPAFLFLGTLLLFPLLFPQQATADLTPTFGWTEPLDTDTTDPPTGYVLKYDSVSGGLGDGDYGVEVDVGNVTSYTLPLALNPSENWYFVVMAYNLDGDGPNTGELHYSTYDTDGDGLEDGIETHFYGTSVNSDDSDDDGLLDADEPSIYGTDPSSKDSDSDGLEDSAELAFWGSNWDNDDDNDGIINLLDPDADGDGVNDGADTFPDIFNLHLITSSHPNLTPRVISALQ